MNRKKAFKTTLKLIIAFLAVGFVIHKVISSPDFKTIPSIILGWSFYEVYILVIIFFLMIINWSLETFKWQAALPKEYKLPFYKSFKAVLSGVTTGSITPNRIGEFGGRIMYLKPEHRKKAIPNTLIADLSQFIITIWFGIIAFTIVGYKILNDYSEIPHYSILTLIIGIILLLISITIFINPTFFINYILKIKIIKNHQAAFEKLQNLNIKIKTKLLSYSMLRFLVFILQFYLILNILDVSINFYQTFLGISNMYLANTIIPNIPFTEIALRGSFALIFVGIFSDSGTAIALSTLIIYIINIGIPALFGAIFMMNIKNN